MNHRSLGMLGMLGAPMLLAESVLRELGRGDGDPLIALAEVLYIGGWICSLTGMGMLRVTGDGIASSILFGIQLVGLLMALAFSIIEPIVGDAAHASVAASALDAAWPISHLLMIAAGIAVLVVGRWASPWKLAPLLCGLALPVTMLAGSALGISRQSGLLIFGAWTAVSFSMIGSAVRNAPEGIESARDVSP